MLSQKHVTVYKSHQGLVRFCQAPVVNDLNPAEPHLEICGVGYRNRFRTTYKNVDLCNRHLRLRETRKTVMGRKTHV